MKIIQIIYKKIAPTLNISFFRILAVTFLAMAILGALSLYLQMPLSSSVEQVCTYLFTLALIALVWKFSQASAIYKIAFSCLTLLSSLSLTGIIPLMGQDSAIASITCGALGFLGAFYSVHTSKNVAQKKRTRHPTGKTIAPPDTGSSSSPATTPMSSSPASAGATRPPKTSDHTAKGYVDQSMQTMVNGMIAQINHSSESFDIVLEHDFQHTMIYYELAKRTESATDKAAWRTILENLEKRVTICIKNSPRRFAFDSSIELARLENKRWDIEVVELHAEDLYFDTTGQKTKLARALEESFASSSVTNFEELIDSCLHRGDRLFVARNRSHPHQIYGGLFIQNKPDGSHFMHSFCKRASATKIKLTECMQHFLKKNIFTQKSGTFVCTVKVDNLIAQGIYTRLGFKITKKDPPTIKDPQYHMQLALA